MLLGPGIVGFVIVAGVVGGGGLGAFFGGRSFLVGGVGGGGEWDVGLVGHSPVSVRGWGTGDKRGGCEIGLNE